MNYELWKAGKKKAQAEALREEIIAMEQNIPTFEGEDWDNNDFEPVFIIPYKSQISVSQINAHCIRDNMRAEYDADMREVRVFSNE